MFEAITIKVTISLSPPLSPPLSLALSLSSSLPPFSTTHETLISLSYRSMHIKIKTRKLFRFLIFCGNIGSFMSEIVNFITVIIVFSVKNKNLQLNVGYHISGWNGFVSAIN